MLRGVLDSKGQMLVLAAVMVVLLLSIVLFATDLGIVLVVRNQLQTAADAAALAGASALELNAQEVGSRAIMLATMNKAAGVPIDAGEVGVTLGYFDPTERDLMPAGKELPNAVRAIVGRTAANGHPLELLFADLIGVESVDVSAEAIAIRGFPKLVGAITFDIQDVQHHRPWTERAYIGEFVSDIVTESPFEPTFPVVVSRRFVEEHLRGTVELRSNGEEGDARFTTFEARWLPPVPFGVEVSHLIEPPEHRIPPGTVSVSVGDEVNAGTVWPRDDVFALLLHDDGPPAILGVADFLPERLRLVK